jgi:membrane dipeptidase
MMKRNDTPARWPRISRWGRPRAVTTCASALLLLASGFVSAQTDSPPPSRNGERPLPVVVTPEALEIHHAGMLFDGHNDLPWRVREDANSSFDKCDIRQPQPQMHTDIDRLRSGGVKAQFWSVYVPVSTSLGNQALLTTLQQIELVHAMCERYPDVFEIALTAADVRRIVESGKIASLMGVEGGHSIENSLTNLQRLYQRGARYMTLTHSKNTEWADSCTDEAKHNGLSDFGRQVVLEMNRLGMLVDISHVSPKTMHDVLDTTKAPVIFSHSSTRAICDHPRNVPDDVLKRLPDNGGVVMINFFSGFVVPTDPLQEERSTRGTIHDVVDHIVHAIEVAGVDHVGIGSDFDGISRVPVGLEDVGTYPAITQLLLDRGLDRESIHKVLGGNVLRVMEQAEAVARQMQSSSSD